MESHTNDYWTHEEVKALEGVTSFEEAADIAVVILTRMRADGNPTVQVCGPMSTGGLGSLKANMDRFQKAVDLAVQHGLTVFNQIPFQTTIIRLTNFREDSADYDMDILERFYRRVFESGLLDKTLYLPDWETSVGAIWERQLATELGMAVEDYPAEWLAKL